MSWATAAIAAGPLFQGIGQALFSRDPDEDARLRHRRYKRRRVKELDKDLMTGITDADFARIAALFRKGTMPMINRFVGKSAGRFGSRSGKVSGAMATATGQYLGVPLANFAGRAKELNLQTKRYLHSAYST